MNFYEQTIQKELEKWHKDMQKPPAMLNKLSKAAQSKIQALIPEKIQNALTVAIRKMTETIMFGSGILTGPEDAAGLTLSEADFLADKAYRAYSKTAVAQGVGFGSGGIVLGIADFPALLSIKVKFLFECARLYGYNVNSKQERLYMLYIFQLAFSSDEHRLRIYDVLMNWDRQTVDPDDMDWEKFQTEYRDYIDLAKMLQLLPVVGAVAGGVANYRLLEKLKVTAVNCYRCRRIKEC